MRVLVTGANGFVGKHLCAHLRTCGYEVDTVRRIVPDTGCATRIEGGWEAGWPTGLGYVDLRNYSVILHLAAPSEARLFSESAVDDHTAPMKALVEAAGRPGTKCGILFISSQSASESATSAYGLGKWRCERILQKCSARHVIIKPGLIVGKSERGAGLFAKIDSVIRLLPIVPVPAHGCLKVQPIAVDDVIRIIGFMLPRFDEFSGRVIGIAGPSRSLPRFVQDACWESRIIRWIVPIPASFASISLRILSALALASNFTPERLEALKRSIPIDCEEIERLTGIELTPFGIPTENWSDTQKLRWEARLITRQVLGAEPTERMIQRYIEAHRKMPHLLMTSLAERGCFWRTKLGIQLLEFVNRSANGALSQKFWLLCYLAECEPRFAARFFRARGGRFRAWASLLVSASMWILAVVIRAYMQLIRRCPPRGAAD